MTKVFGKAARLLALLGWIAALLGPAAPGIAAVAPAEPAPHHAAMDCGGVATDSHKRAPIRHMPGAMDCCVANICAMNLALPASLSDMALPAYAEASRYNLHPLLQPVGIDAAPIPHPPKTSA